MIWIAALMMAAQAGGATGASLIHGCDGSAKQELSNYRLQGRRGGVERTEHDQWFESQSGRLL